MGIYIYTSAAEIINPFEMCNQTISWFDERNAASNGGASVRFVKSRRSMRRVHVRKRVRSRSQYAVSKIRLNDESKSNVAYRSPAHSLSLFPSLSPANSLVFAETFADATSQTLAHPESFQAN